VSRDKDTATAETIWDYDAEKASRLSWRGQSSREVCRIEETEQFAGLLESILIGVKVESGRGDFNELG